MIKITEGNFGTAVWVSPENVAKIAETGASSQWHGIKSIVRLFDGTVVEAQESAKEIAKMVNDALPKG